MGQITSGIGLVSGINTGQLIESLLALEGRGRTTLQQRVALLQSQKTALMDINARLLNLKTAGGAFKANNIFQSRLANSSLPDVLSATATTATPIGTYQFMVRQLVSNSQYMTRGFANTTTAPVGLDSLSFEFGNGMLSRDVELSELNGGEGVRRGRISITDAAGATATVDLRDATTMNEVLTRINDAAVGATASLDGDRLVITDTSGGAGTMSITNVAGSFTASDLGIAGSATGGVINGAQINRLGLGSGLASLNDGNGVFTRNGVADFRIELGSGTTFNIDLGRIDSPITGTTLLSSLNNGLGIRTNSSTDDPDIKFTARDGSVFEVDLTGVTTVAGLINRVSTATEGKIELSITSGDRMTVTDTTGGTGLLKIQGAGPNGTRTAMDLRILNEAGVSANTFTGQRIPNSDNQPAAATLEDVINRINSQTSGAVTAAIASDGVSLMLTAAGGETITMRRGAMDGSSVETAIAERTLRDLGFVEGQTATGSIQSSRLTAGMGSVLLRNLNGGAGLGSGTGLSITDRSGNTANITVDPNASLADVIRQINTNGTANITASLNAAGNGLLLKDNTGAGGNLIVGGDAAGALGIETDPAGVASATVRGKNVQLRYVSEASKLSALNYGRGVGTGKFRLTDSQGESAVVDIDSDSATLYDIIQEINSRGLAIEARVNENGDGLILVDTSDTPTSKMKVETVSGTTAKDLGILGTAKEVGGSIDGTYEKTVAIDSLDTLSRIVSKVNAAGIPVSASILNSGAGSLPFRLTFNSTISGTNGDLVIDTGGFDLGLTQLAKAQDAKIFFGSDDPAQAVVLRSSSNTFNNVVQGMTITASRVSEDPVTINVERDEPQILAGVQRFVSAFNDVIARIAQYDSYNTETERKGVLLGNPTTSRVRDLMYRTVNGPAKGVTGAFRYLSQVGIKAGRDGQLTIDEEKFKAAYASDPEGVESLFAAFEATANPSEEISPGVTVQREGQTFSQLGFGELFKKIADELTNTTNGVVTRADRSFTSMIEGMRKRITQFDQKLEARRLRLQTEFAGMEASLARLQGQSGSLNSLASAVLLAQTRLGR